MKHKILLLFVFFGLLSKPSISQGSYGKQITYYIGAQYSRDYNVLQLIDDPHRAIDTNLQLGLSDADYIKLRKLNDLRIWKEHFGLKFGYSLNPYLYFETGAVYYKGGIKITPTTIVTTNSPGDSAFVNIFSSLKDISQYLIQYNVFEVPFNFRLKPNMDDRKSRFFPLLSAGIGMGFATQKLYYYNYIENANIARNFGLTASVGLGLRKEIDQTMYFEINSFYRTTLINHFAYAPVQSFYQNLGIEATLGWIVKGNSMGTSDLILSCKDFSQKHLRRFNLGIQYGGLYNMTINNGTNKELFTLYGHPEVDTSKVKNYTTSISGIPGYSIGLYVECRLNPIFSLGFTPAFSQRGFKISDQYYFKDSTVAPLLLQGNIRFNYLDFPAEFIFSPVNRLKLFIGGMASVFMRDKIYEFSYSPHGYIGEPVDIQPLSGYNRIMTYFGKAPRDLIWGAYLGSSYDVDNRLALALKAQYSSSMMAAELSELNISNIYFQASIILYLNKHGFKTGSVRR